MRAQRGFTLLEVLVSLAVLALAMGALIRSGAENVANAGYLADRSFAHWVAMNRAAELRLQPGAVSTGRQNGTEWMAGREWRWEVTVSNTPDQDIRRVDIAVSAVDGDPEAPLARAVAFLPPPEVAPETVP